MSFLSAVRDSESTSKTATVRAGVRKHIWIGLPLVTLFSAMASGIYWWSEHRYDYFPKRWGAVIPGKIYRSGQLTPQILGETLTKYGITTIIDLQLNDLKDPHLQGEVQYAAEHGLRHFRCGLGGDGTGDADRYVDAVAILIQCVRDNQPVLVHCGAGTQRTGGVIACYRLLAEHADPEEVYQELKEYDWDPNEDWELVHYINTHLPYIAAKLIERGALESVPAEIPQLPE